MFHMSMEGEGKSHAIVGVVCLTQDELDGHRPNTVCCIVASAKSHDYHMTILYCSFCLRTMLRWALISITTSPFTPKMDATCKLKTNLNVSCILFSLSLSSFSTAPSEPPSSDSNGGGGGKKNGGGSNRSEGGKSSKNGTVAAVLISMTIVIILIVLLAFVLYKKERR